MDDGGLLLYSKDYPRKGLVFNTHGFSLVEVEILSNNLNNAYGFRVLDKNQQKQTNNGCIWKKVRTD